MGLDHLSRRHSQLTFDHNSQKLFIEDAGSSFGTLKFLRQPIVMTMKDQYLTLQIENSLIRFQSTLQKDVLKMNKIDKKRSLTAPKPQIAFSQLNNIFGMNVQQNPQKITSNENDNAHTRVIPQLQNDFPFRRSYGPSLQSNRA
jgi:hypothetical protein